VKSSSIFDKSSSNRISKDVHVLSSEGYNMKHNQADRVKKVITGMKLSASLQSVSDKRSLPSADIKIKKHHKDSVRVNDSSPNINPALHDLVSNYTNSDD
jgi:hypothetical protein